jgi:hypothetical protein
MRYEVKNLGPGPFFCIESGKLLQPGDSVDVNRLDDGTKRLGEGGRPRLAILDRHAAPPQERPVLAKALAVVPEGAPEREKIEERSTAAAAAPDLVASDPPVPVSGEAASASGDDRPSRRRAK